MLNKLIEKKDQRGKIFLIGIFLLVFIFNLFSVLLFNVITQKSINQFIIASVVQIVIFINMYRGVKWAREISGGITLWTSFFYLGPSIFKAGFDFEFVPLYIQTLVFGLSGFMLFFSTSILEFMKVQKIKYQKVIN